MAQKSSLNDFLLLLKRWGQQSVLSRLLALVIHVKTHGFCFFPPSSLFAPSPLAPKNFGISWEQQVHLTKQIVVS